MTTDLLVPAPPATPPPPARRTQPRPRPPQVDRDLRLRRGVFALGIVLLPVTIPRGPANTSPADIGVALCILVVLIGAASRGTVLRVPYLLGMGMMIIAGLLATELSGAHLSSALAIVQDVMVLAWGAAVANAARDPRILSVILRTWVGASSFYALLVLIGMTAGIDALAGRSDEYGFRASFLLGDPNVSGNYFLVSFFLLMATRRPVLRRYRYPMAALLLSAVALSGSNGALLGLVGGVGVAVLVGVGTRHGLVPVVAIVSSVVAAVVWAGPHVHPQAVQQWAADSVPLLRDGLGRGDQSSSERDKLWHESLGLWYEGHLMGIGPVQTKSTFERQLAPYVKEAHNDYFAALVERGLLGILGLVVLGATIAVRVVRPIRQRASPAFAALVPRPEYLLAAVLATAVAGLFYEVLHFRHLWALLGVVAALDLWGRGE